VIIAVRTYPSWLTAAVLLVVFCVSGNVSAGEPEFENTFDLDREPAFRDYRGLVNAYVIRRRAKLPTEACVIGLIGPDRLKHAWVVWSKGREIILLEGGDTDLRMSRRRLRIPADVVDREAELKGSTYLVTRAWVNDLTRACDERGTKVRVQRQKK
jgi:hypothetical protein